MAATFPPGQGPGTLYVFLHGLICPVETKDELLGLVIDMGEAHSYRAGGWLTETPLPRQSVFDLRGVTAGQAKLDDKKVSIVRRPLFPFPALYATLRFPKPKSIRSLRRTNFPASLVSGSGAASVSKTGDGQFTIAALQVLEYDFAETANVMLGDGSFWRCPSVTGNDRSVTLHFFAEPESMKGPDHQIDEFRQALGLFRLFDTELRSPLNLRDVEEAEYPAGIPASEAAGLVERKPLLAAMAASLKTGIPFQDVAMPVGGGGPALCGPFAASTEGVDG